MATRVCNALIWALERLIGALVLLLITLAFTQVVLRYGFAAAILWVEEISVMALIWLAWIGIVYLWLARSHIVVDLLMPVLSLSAANRLAIAINALAVVGGAALTVISFGTVDAYSGMEMGSLEIEASIKYYPILVGGAGVAVAALLDIWRRLGSSEPDP